MLQMVYSHKCLRIKIDEFCLFWDSTVFESLKVKKSQNLGF